MKRLCAVLLVTAFFPAAAAEAACAPRKGERVVVKSKRAVVVKKGDSFVGCRYSTGRRHLLVEIGDRFREFASHFVLAGDKLAWVYRTGNTSHMYRDNIRVIDTRRWRRARWVQGPANDYSSDAMTVERLVLSTRGWVAWRWSHYGHQPSGPVSGQFIDMNDHTGTRRLDAGQPDSLGGPRFASASRVVLTHDGARRAARVPPRKPCALGYGDQVVAESERVIVTKQADTWRGCRFSTGRRAVLAVDKGSPSPQHASQFVTAGDHVAFVDTQYVAIYIAVVDSRTWAYPEKILVGSYRASAGETLHVEQLALSEAGSVAWRARDDDADPHTESIGLADAGGARALDSGPVGSLTGPLFDTPARLVWTHDGEQRGTDVQPGPPST